MTDKQKLMELIDSMPPHEGKSFEEALADHLMSNGVAVPVCCKECEHCDKRYFNGLFLGLCEIRKDSYGDRLKVGLSDYCSDGRYVKQTK